MSKVIYWLNDTINSVHEADKARAKDYAHIKKPMNGVCIWHHDTGSPYDYPMQDHIRVNSAICRTHNGDHYYYNFCPLCGGRIEVVESEP